MFQSLYTPTSTSTQTQDREGSADSTRMLEPLSIVQGPMGLRTWLSEVQFLMGKLKQRSFSGIPMYVAPPCPCPVAGRLVQSLIEIDKHRPRANGLVQDTSRASSPGLVFRTMASTTRRCRESALPDSKVEVVAGRSLTSTSVIWDVPKPRL